VENSYQKFTKDVIVIGITQILISLSGIIFLPLITKKLGAADYGIWTQVLAAISLVTGLVGLGLPYAMTRFLPIKTKKEEIQEEFWSVFTLVSLVTIIISIIIIIAAKLIARFFFNGATDIIRITGLIILVNSLNGVFTGFFRSLRQMIRYAIFSILNKYCQIGLIVILVLNGQGIMSMTLALLAINIAILFSLFLVTKHQIGIIRPHFNKIKDYLSFGIPTIPGNISAWVVFSSDTFVIGYFLGVFSVGIYSAATGLGDIPIMIISILGFILPPALAKLYDEGKMHELKIHISYSLKYSLALAIPFVFGAAVLGEPILRLFSTPEIAEKGHIILTFETINSLVLVSCGVVNHILVVVKKTRIIGISWIIAAAINLGLNVLMVPRIGIIGGVLSTFVAYLAAEIIQLYFSFKEFTIPIDWRFIIKCLIASGIMSIVIWLMKPTNSYTILLTVLVGVITYGITIIVLKGFSRNEFVFFRGLVSGLLRIKTERG
jgi:O-antigen/teichoic acid export membrane protein